MFYPCQISLFIQFRVSNLVLWTVVCYFSQVLRTRLSQSSDLSVNNAKFASAFFDYPRIDLLIHTKTMQNWNVKRTKVAFRFISLCLVSVLNLKLSKLKVLRLLFK